MRFVEAAKRAFSFLEDTGFRLTAIDVARLQYESARACVTIEWDPRSGELEVFFCLQPKNAKAHDAFSLRDLLDMENVDVPERKMPFQVAKEDELKPFVDKLAEETRNHAQSALAGDRMYFRRLQAYRNAKAQAYMYDMELRRVRAEAEKAWKKKEFDKLVLLYTSIEDQLTASEKAKLAYAKQHQVH